jgi:hypothetical protein
MPTTTETENATLEELITWIKKLTQAGVSPDVAAEVAKDFLIIDYDTCDDEDYEEQE